LDSSCLSAYILEVIKRKEEKEGRKDMKEEEKRDIPYQDSF